MPTREHRLEAGFGEDARDRVALVVARDPDGAVRHRAAAPGGRALDVHAASIPGARMVVRNPSELP